MLKGETAQFTIAYSYKKKTNIKSSYAAECGNFA